MLDTIPQVPGSVAPEAGQAVAQRDALDRDFEAFLRGQYRIEGRKAIVLPPGASQWAAQQLRLDNAAKQWGGKRVDVPWHRVGYELYGIWPTRSPATFVGMAMSKEPVDAEGRHLLVYCQLIARDEG